MTRLLLTVAVAAGTLSLGGGVASAECPPTLTCFPGCPPPTVDDLTHPTRLITRACPG